MTSAVIRAENPSRRFGDNLAVDNLDLQVHSGEVFGFLGHNGAGKTTTVRLLNGVLEPHAGSHARARPGSHDRRTRPARAHRRLDGIRIPG